MSRTKGSKNKPKDTAMPTASTEVATIEHVPQEKMMLLDYMADKYSLRPEEFSRTVKAICGMPTATPEQFAAFLLVAKTYNLNPLVKEIYAFPAKTGGIVPIVSVDGWVNLVNSQGQCDGFTFEMQEEGERLISCTCSIYRKDRKHPVSVTEYYSECVRSTEPWKMKHRMLRHKAFIQAARYAFGFSGIYDEDEGQKIAEIDPSRDAAPPRTATAVEPKQIEHEPPRAATAPEPGPGEDHAAGEVQDGAPPRRAPKPAEAKVDPVTSGPQRAAPKADAQTVAPYKIPGTNETFESWAEKYIDNIKTSPDMATAYGWIDKNSDPLARLAKGRATTARVVKVATERVMETLRDAQEKAKGKADKAAAKAKSAEPPPGDMDDEPTRDMGGDTGHGFGGPDYGKPADDNPETVLAWIDATLADIYAPEDLENIWMQHCEPKILDLMPPDKNEAQGIYRKHEKRLEP